MRYCIVTFLALVLAFAKADNCFEYNTDYDGANINNGLEQRTDNEQDCWTLCKYTNGCEGFTWASGNFYGTIKGNISGNAV